MEAMQENTTADSGRVTPERVNLTLTGLNNSKDRLTTPTYKIEADIDRPLESTETKDIAFQKQIKPESIPSTVTFLNRTHSDFRYYKESTLILMYAIGSLLEGETNTSESKLFLADRVLRLETALNVMSGNIDSPEIIQKVLFGDCNPDMIRMEILDSDVEINNALKKYSN